MSHMLPLLPDSPHERLRAGEPFRCACCDARRGTPDPQGREKLFVGPYTDAEGRTGTASFCSESCRDVGAYRHNRPWAVPLPPAPPPPPPVTGDQHFLIGILQRPGTRPITFLAGRDHAHPDEQAVVDERSAAMCDGPWHEKPVEGRFCRCRTEVRTIVRVRARKLYAAQRQVLAALAGPR